MKPRKRKISKQTEKLKKTQLRMKPKQKQPRNRLLIETDSPYLAPVPFRGNENTPGLLILAAAAAARVRGATLEELAELTWRNAMDFFRIGEGAK